MIVVTIASVLALAAVSYSPGSDQRAAFSACLKESIAKAKSAKIASGAFDAFARSHCAAQEAALRKAVVAFDVKNGISRKDANESATLELDDYFLGTAERYEAEAGPAEPEQVQAKAEPPVPQPPQQ